MWNVPKAAAPPRPARSWDQGRAIALAGARSACTPLGQACPWGPGASPARPLLNSTSFLLPSSVDLCSVPARAPPHLHGGPCHTSSCVSPQWWPTRVRGPSVQTWSGAAQGWAHRPLLNRLPPADERQQSVRRPLIILLSKCSISFPPPSIIVL